jgi:hypothetical protein
MLSHAALPALPACHAEPRCAARPAGLQWELERWGVRDGAGPSGSGGRRRQADTGAGRAREEEGAFGPGDYSYIDSYGGAAGQEPGGFLGHAGYSGAAQPAAPMQPQRPQHPQQAQQQPAGVGAREMDPAQLAQLMQGLDFEDEDAHPAFLCPITHVSGRPPAVGI